MKRMTTQNGGLLGGRPDDLTDPNVEDDFTTHSDPATEDSRYPTEETASDYGTVDVEISTSDKKHLYENDENPERGNWSGRLDFLLSMLGWSVGFGNVWRFPYICFRNGGGAFLIPYVVVLITVGIPLFFLEVSLAQFCSQGPLTCWGYAPLFKGIGIAMCIISALSNIYYNMLIAYSQFFLFASFTSSLPWASCDGDWNTANCSLKLPSVNCTGNDMKQYPNGTCYNSTGFHGLWNYTVYQTQTGMVRISPSEEYFNNYVLDISDDINDLGSPNWRLVLNLLLAWIICFFCLFKGVKTTGKVVYFTALFPYVILIILFFRGVVLPNAGAGVSFYITPTWEKLASATVWRDAAVQIFYSLGMGWGGLHALASYNKFHNNTLRDSLIVSVAGCLTSFFAGFVIFSYLGFMAGELGVDVQNVTQNGGPGLAFIVYPAAVTHLPAPTLWAILFFLMLITLGLDSQFVTVETVLTAICDEWPKLRPKKTLVLVVICVIEFLLGLPLTTRGGMYVFHLMNDYIGVWGLPIVCLCESLSISYVYGINRFFNDLTIMLGSRPFFWWKICWMVVSPGVTVFILIFSWTDYQRAQYDKYVFPWSAEIVAIILGVISVLAIPGYMLFKIKKEDDGKNLREKLRLLTLPTRSWGPAQVQFRQLVDYVPGFVVDPAAETRQLSYVNAAFTASSGSITFTKGEGSLSPSRRSGKASVGTISGISQSDLSFYSYESTI